MGIDGIENLFGNDFPDSVNHDDTDVPAALERNTQDGSGFVSISGDGELPPSDFEEETE